MSRVPLLALDAMNPTQREQYQRFPSHLTQALLLTAPRLAAAIPNTANALRAATLDAKTREGAILRVAALSGSAFERMQHLGEAQKAGWSADEIAAIEAIGNGASPLLGGFNAVLAFVDECVAAPRVTDATFARLSAHWPAGDIATLILLVGHYMMVARLLATLDIELDPAPTDWQTEH